MGDKELIQNLMSAVFPKKNKGKKSQLKLTKQEIEELMEKSKVAVKKNKKSAKAIKKLKFCKTDKEREAEKLKTTMTVPVGKGKTKTVLTKAGAAKLAAQAGEPSAGHAGASAAVTEPASKAEPKQSLSDLKKAAKEAGIKSINGMNRKMLNMALKAKAEGNETELAEIEQAAKEGKRLK